MSGVRPLPLLLLGLSVLFGGCTADDGHGPGDDAPESIQVTSGAFADGARIPDKFTCEGANVKPPLQIAALPEDTRSVVLIVDDPDAPRGTWTHYTVWGIPPDEAEWQDGADLRARGATEGETSSGGTGYRGPCPPPGDEAHRYFFRAYALDRVLDLEAGASRAALEDALAGAVVAQGHTMGTYSRGE